MGREFIIPKKIISGKGALNDAGKYLSEMGKKALIVTGPHVLKLECFKSVEKLLDSLGISYTVFSDITGEPTDVMIDKGVSVYKDNGCDFLIAVGGGSPLDSMKAIAALAVNGGSISDYMGKTIEGRMPPMAAIPTTAGTGSEATQFTVITDSKKDIKMLLKGICLIPDLAVIDPGFSMTSPKSITASTGLDALTHAVESYTSKKAQPLTDCVAMSAVKRIFEYLPRAYKDGNDAKAREEMSIAALEAGIAINNASVTIVHGMSRPIGALFHVPHGLSNAMLLPACMKYALSGTYEKFADLGRAVGLAKNEDTDKSAAESFLKGLRKICEICEVPTLKKYGIDKEKFFDVIPKMATDAIASGSPGNTVRDVTEAAVMEIYRSLWN